MLAHVWSELDYTRYIRPEFVLTRYFPTDQFTWAASVKI